MPLPHYNEQMPKKGCAHTARSSAFAPVRKPNGLVCCPPPSCHFLAYCTGGLENLFNEITTNSQQPIHDFGAFTKDKGRFKPKQNMSLLALRYRYVQVLAEGQSCVVIKALDTFKSNAEVSIKVLHLNYCKLGTQEVDVIRQLNQADPYRFSAVLRLQNTFMFDDHFCMVFDYYNPFTLVEHLSNVSGKARLEFIRKAAARLVLCLGFLQSQNVIHADIKVENILLADQSDPNSVRLVDFGNAIHCVHNEMSLYYQDFELQTLLYRAPEVMYGLPFGTEVDLWSLGGVLAHLFMGKPFVLGKSKQSVVAETVKILGPLPKKIFQKGKFYRTLEQFTKDTTQVDLVYPLMTKLGSFDYHFCDFLAGLLQYDPKRRLTPQQAAAHAFLAPILGFGHLGPQYSLVPVSRTYTQTPMISEDVRREDLSPVDLLRNGTVTKPKRAVSPLPVIGVKRDRLELLRSRKRDHQATEDEVNDDVVSQLKITAKVDALDISSVSDMSQTSASELGFASSPQSTPENKNVTTTEVEHKRNFSRMNSEKQQTDKYVGNRDENFNLKTRTVPNVIMRGKNSSSEFHDSTKILERETPKLKRLNFVGKLPSSRQRARETMDSDSDDTALLSPQSSVSSLKSKAIPTSSMKEMHSAFAETVRNGLTSLQPISVADKTKKPRLVAPVADSLISGIVRSTPVMKQLQKPNQGPLDLKLPNFGNISPITSKKTFQVSTGLSTKCKKSLSFKQTPKRKRSVEDETDKSKRTMGYKTLLMREVYGDIYEFQSPNK